MRRGTEAALGRSDVTRRGFTARDGEGRTGPPPARGVKSGSATAPPAGTGGGGRCSVLFGLVSGAGRLSLDDLDLVRAHAVEVEHGLIDLFL